MDIHRRDKHGCRYYNCVRVRCTLFEFIYVDCPTFPISSYTNETIFFYYNSDHSWMKWPHIFQLIQIFIFFKISLLMQKNRFSNLNSKLWLFLILGDTCKYVKVCPQFLISITWQPILANNIKWLILTFVQVPSCWSGPSILKKYYINGHNVIGPTCTNLSSAHAKRHHILHIDYIILEAWALMLSH